MCSWWNGAAGSAFSDCRFSLSALLISGCVASPSCDSGSTLSAREYVTRERRTLFPTELGLKVNDLLVKNLDALFNVEFTAEEVTKVAIEQAQAFDAELHVVSSVVGHQLDDDGQRGHPTPPAAGVR